MRAALEECSDGDVDIDDDGLLQMPFRFRSRASLTAALQAVAEGPLRESPLRCVAGSGKDSGERFLGAIDANGVRLEALHPFPVEGTADHAALLGELLRGGHCRRGAAAGRGSSTGQGREGPRGTRSRRGASSAG